MDSLPCTESPMRGTCGCSAPFVSASVSVTLGQSTHRHSLSHRHAQSVNQSISQSVISAMQAYITIGSGPVGHVGVPATLSVGTQVAAAGEVTVGRSGGKNC